MYFVIEGPDMAGKTTQLEALEQYYREHHYDVVITREPGGTEIGEKIREIVKDPEMQKEMRALTNLFLFNAARCQTAWEIINNQMTKSSPHVTLSDRSFFSTIAYQGFGQAKKVNGEYVREVDLEDIITICELAMGKGPGMLRPFFFPNIIFYIDISYEESLHRKAYDKKREGQKDGFDDREEEFHLRVREGYEWAAERYKDVVIRINGERPPEEITQDILGHISAYFRRGNAA